MTEQQPVRYFNVPEDTIYLILGILRLEKDGVKNPASNIDTALEELKECCAGRSDRRQPAPSSKHGINLVKYVKREMTPEQQEVLRKLQCDTGYGDWEIPFDLDEHDAAVAEKARKDEREKVLEGKLSIIDNAIEDFRRPDLNDMSCGFLNGLLYARDRIFGSEQRSLRQHKEEP